MKLKDFVGLHFLSGVELSRIADCNCIKFTLDGITYFIEEDPADGYRSYCSDLKTSDSPCRFSFPPLQVMCMMDPHEDPDDGVLWFIDAVTGKRVLEIGNEDYEDYYPTCVIRYRPEDMAHNIGESDRK